MVPNLNKPQQASFSSSNGQRLGKQATSFDARYWHSDMWNAAVRRVNGSCKRSLLRSMGPALLFAAFAALASSDGFAKSIFKDPVGWGKDVVDSAREDGRNRWPWGSPGRSKS